MDIQSLKSKIQRLEDIEEIKNLQAKYTYLIDAKQLDEASELMTDDVTAEFLPAGKFGSKAELMGALKGLVSVSRLMRHQVMNPYIEVDGNRAKARWYLFGPFTSKTSRGDVAHWLQGEYNNEYLKVDGKWKISKLHFTFTFQTPYEDGWVKTPMMNAR